MKVIKQYFLFSFLKPFFMGLSAFMTIMIITHFFDYLHSFLSHKPSAILLLKYFVYRIPEWFVSVTPVATLLGVLFSFGNLNRNHEITAIKSSGIRLIYILKPLIIFSVFLSLFTGIVFEFVVPATNSKAERLFRIIKNKEPLKRSLVRENFAYVGENNRLFIIKKYENQKITGLKIIEFEPGTLLERKRIIAKKAEYIDGVWILQDGNTRIFSTKNSETESFDPFTELKLLLPETPRNFSKPAKTPEEMDFFVLLDHIKKLKKGGLSSRKERVLLHYKISFPFSNSIIMILGVPIALWKDQKSRATVFFISILICFIYWGAISTGRALGVGGILPPVLGVWSANILFFFISILMMKYTKVLEN